MRLNLKIYGYSGILAILVLCALVVTSCAKQGYPSGGPVDKQPPKVKGVNPVSETTNFNTKRFRIDFDEYVTMKDADNNVLISPPMKVKPEYQTKGHSLIVKLNDTLAPNTTYLFQFKGAIVDFNEGNPLPSFEYVFSTGDLLDSMTIGGKVVDALKQAPTETPVTVVAYRMTAENEALGDSIVALGSPTYQTRTASDGSFQFNYMTPGRYKIIALDDADKNLKHSASEAIAWLDTLVTAQVMPKPADTTVSKNDTIAQTPDTVSVFESKPLPLLQLSMKENNAQRVLHSSFTAKGSLQIITQVPMKSPVVEADSVEWSLNSKGDTLRLWTLHRTRDSLHIVLRDSATSLNDTLVVKYREPKKSKRKSDSPEQDLNGVHSLVSSSHPYFDTMKVCFDVPVIMHLSDISIFCYSDSSSINAHLTLDSSHTVGSIVGDTPLKQGEKYKVTIPTGIYRDLYGRANDSLVITTTLTSASDYGALSFDISVNGMMQHPVVQLLDDKGTVVGQQAVLSTSFQFENLKPATYRLRIFDDLDGNGEWTPGDYYLHRQPEQVLYFKKSLQLRANWEVNETWEL